MNDTAWSRTADGPGPRVQERVGERPWVRAVSLVDDRETDRRMRRMLRRRRGGG